MCLFNLFHKNTVGIVTVVIPCHNQDDIVRLNIELLLNEQLITPNFIVVINDHSRKFNIEQTKQVRTFDAPLRGRVNCRNFGIEKALELGSDVIIFMDGDSIPKDDSFIRNYIKLDLAGPKMVFGMRNHIDRPKDLSKFNYDFDYESIKVKKFPSDLLTANLDRKYIYNNTEDLRVVSEAEELFSKSKDFNEKANLITSGMITWSCNFLITKEAAEILKTFMKKVYDVDGYFDNKTFGADWGGEDNAFGLDSHFAGIDIKTTKKSNILHFMHERTDSLFTHVKLGNLMINRLINLHKITNK